MARFTIEVDIDARKARVGARVVKRSTEEMDRATKGAAGSQQKLSDNVEKGSKSLSTWERHAKRAAVVTLAVGVAVAGLSAKFATDFQDSMTKVNTLVGVNIGQVNRWKGALLDLAPATGVGPRALSEALFTVTSAGERGAGALEILEQSAKASAVGLGDTKQIAQATTAALQAYQSTGLTAAKATDILVATVREGNLEASELAPVLGRVIGIASQLGISFAEVGGFIATFTRLGVRADEAVTALRGTMSALLGPTKQQQDALKTVGLTMADLKREIQEKGLAAALGDLVARFQGNEDALAAVIPNVRALSGILGTAGAQGETFRQIQDSITNSTGILDTAFKELKESSPAQTFRELRAGLEALLIQVGQGLLPVLGDLASKVQKMAASDDLKRLAQGVGESLARGIELTAGAVSTLATNWDLLMVPISAFLAVSLVAKIQGISAALTTLAANPVGAAIVGFGLLAVAVHRFTKRLDEAHAALLREIADNQKVKVALEQSRKETENSAAAMDRMRAVQGKLQREFGKTLTEVRRLEEELEAARRKGKDSNDFLFFDHDALAEARTRLQETENHIFLVNQEMSRLKGLPMAVSEEVDTLSGSLGALNVVTGEAKEKTSQYKDELTEILTRTARAAEEAERLLEARKQGEAAVERERRLLEIENALLEANASLRSDVGRQIVENTRRRQEAEDALNNWRQGWELLDAEIERSEGVLKGQGQTARTEISATERVFDNFLRGVQGSMADTFEQIFSGQLDSWKDFFDQVFKLFIRMLAEMAAAAAAQQIGLNITSGGGGALSSGLNASGGGGLFGSLFGAGGGSGSGAAIAGLGAALLVVGALALVYVAVDKMIKRQKAKQIAAEMDFVVEDMERVSRSWGRNGPLNDAMVAMQDGVHELLDQIEQMTGGIISQLPAIKITVNGKGQIAAYVDGQLQGVFSDFEEAFDAAMTAALNRATLTGAGPAVTAALANSAATTVEGLLDDLAFALSLEQAGLPDLVMRLQDVGRGFDAVRARAEELGITLDIVVQALGVQLMALRNEILGISVGEDFGGRLSGGADFNELIDQLTSDFEAEISQLFRELQIAEFLAPIRDQIEGVLDGIDTADIDSVTNGLERLGHLLSQFPDDAEAILAAIAELEAALASLPDKIDLTDLAERLITEFAGFGTAAADLAAIKIQADDLRAAIESLGLSSEETARLLGLVAEAEQHRIEALRLDVLDRLVAAMRQSGLFQEEVMRREAEIAQARFQLELLKLRAELEAFGLLTDAILDILGVLEDWSLDLNNFIERSSAGLRDAADAVSRAAPSTPSTVSGGEESIEAKISAARSRRQQKQQRKDALFEFLDSFERLDMGPLTQEVLAMQDRFAEARAEALSLGVAISEVTAAEALWQASMQKSLEARIQALAGENETARRLREISESSMDLEAAINALGLSADETASLLAELERAQEDAYGQVLKDVIRQVEDFAGINTVSNSILDIVDEANALRASVEALGLGAAETEALLETISLGMQSQVQSFFDELFSGINDARAQIRQDREAGFTAGEGIASARQTFEELAARAASGDVSAIQQVGQAGLDFIEIAKQSGLSGTALADLVRSVDATLAGIPDAVEEAGTQDVIDALQAGGDQAHQDAEAILEALELLAEGSLIAGGGGAAGEELSALAAELSDLKSRIDQLVDVLISQQGAG